MKKFTPLEKVLLTVVGVLLLNIFGAYAWHVETSFAKLEAKNSKQWQRMTAIERRSTELHITK
jgi:nicotinamide riboside transporter PnuC